MGWFLRPAHERYRGLRVGLAARDDQGATFNDGITFDPIEGFDGVYGGVVFP